MTRHRLAQTVAACLLAAASLFSCKKNDHPHPVPQPAYSAEVADKWMTLQLRLMRNATGIANQAFTRHYAYTGIALLESLEQELPGNERWTTVWNGLSGLPLAQPSEKHYPPAKANAALAAINKAMFPAAGATDKAAIDSLEAALKGEFLTTQTQAVVEASETFGKAVAAAVFNWAETDGYKNAAAPYTVPAGPGLWKATAPAFAAPATPYWGQNRTLVSGSTANTQPAAPLPYSTDPASPFHQMAKQVYDASKALTDDQKAMALFWRDVPGATTPGHWLSIVQQAVRQTKASLHKAALAYALTGTAINDAAIACFKGKYQHNLMRPITYIREVMGDANWNAFIGTPAHPEYVSAHSSLSAAVASIMERVFGPCGSFTDHTYDYLGFAPRTYSSYAAIAEEAGQSRLYAGIHYTPSIEAGLTLGKKVAENILQGH